MRSKVKIINHASKPKYNFLVIGFVILLLGGVIGGYIGFAAGQVPPPVSHPPGEIFGDGNIIGNILVEGNFGVWSSTFPWTFTITHNIGTISSNFPVVDFSGALMTVAEINAGAVVFPIIPDTVTNRQTYAYPKAYRLIVLPAQVGEPQNIPQAIMDDFCKDFDGCEITLIGKNYAPGAISMTSDHFIIHSTGRQWVSDNPAWFGNDNGDGSPGQALAWLNDCWLTDGDTAGAPNVAIDNIPGMFSLINRVGFWNDATTTCEIIIQDH